MTFYTISSCITHDISSSCSSNISMYKVFVLGRGRSKLSNLCPIPIALCCNKNMFKSILIGAFSGMKGYFTEIYISDIFK